MWSLATAAFMTGLAGSLHCVGMCGPLAMAIPFQNHAGLPRVTSLLLFHTGRIFTYSLLGLVFGLAGNSIYLAGLEQWFSILVGATLLILTVRYYFFRRSSVPTWLMPFYRGLQKKMNIFLHSRSMAGYWMLGAANGLLPCGMVYFAIAGALLSQQVTHSILFMFFFGIGTLPAMMALGIFGMPVTMKVRNQLKKTVPYIATVMALLLILRGMNLGIPFISPSITSTSQHSISCH